jgi:GR25 family glycosyltransferase involved in LPS biosynthesis
MNVSWVPGVDGNNMVEKARPYDGLKLSGPTIGCWRAHADTWRRLLDAPYSTALILEDDIDWDVNIHDIMALVSENMKTALSSAKGPSSSVTSSGPYYHEYWDTLWFGACLSEVPDDVEKTLTVYDDPYAPADEDLRPYDRNYFKQLNIDYPTSGSGMRAIHHARRPTCTYGYAVSKKGAERLLYNVGYRGLSAPVDLVIGGSVMAGRLTGMMVWPPVFTYWRVGGSKDSDISGTPGTDKGNLQGRTFSLKNSARKAMIKEFEEPRPW